MLAFACAFTMFAGAASYSDQADIKAGTAVDMLSSLGVINGYTDGTFKPDVSVTRAEMAKMIFTIINGGNDDASAYQNLPTTFKDLTDTWYQGYIKYLQNSTIIAGTSATTFEPDKTVTGLEAAKMLLVTAGYDAKKAGLTGTAWAANTMRYAQLNNLFEDVDCDINAALPRQYAAQLMYNALDMERVVWSNDIEDFKPATDVKDDATIGGKYMDLVKTDAMQLLSVEKTSGKDTYEISLKKADGTKVSYDKVPTDVSELMGQNVKVLVKAKSNGDTTVYGVYADDDSSVIATGFVGQLDTVSSDTKKIKLDGTEYKLDNATSSQKVYEFNKDTTYVTANLKDLADSIKYNTSNKTPKADNAAAAIKLIDNDGNSKVDTVVVTPLKIGQVTSVTKTAVTVDNGIGTMKFEDDTIYEDVAKKDYVRVIDEDNVAEGGNHVEKLDVTTAKVTGTRNGEAKVDGNWYKLAYNNNGTAVTVDTNTTYDLVIIGNIIVYADEAEGSIKNVAFVSDTKSTFETVVGDSNVTLKARMYFPDGTDAEVKISKIAGTKLKDTDSAATVQSNLKEKLVTYSKLSDGTYDVKLVSDSNLAGTDDYVAEGEKSAVSNSVNGAYYDSKIYGMSVNEDAVVYVKTKNETKILSGKQVKDWDKTVDNLLTFKSDMLVEESNGIDYVKVATLVTTGAADVPGAKDLSYAYAVVDEYTDTVDGEDKIAVDVWNGTETITLHADAASFDVSLKAGDLFSYKTNGNYIEDVSKGYFSASVLGFDGKVEGEMKVQDASDNSINTYTLSEDVVVLTVDDANTKGVDGASLDSIVEAGYNAAGTARIPNIMFMLGTGDDKDKVVAIVIDSENNELD